MSGRAVAGLVGVALIAGATAIFLLRDDSPDQTPVRPPNARSLLRQDTVVTLSRSADLDGDGVPEVILASRSTMFGQFQLPAQYLDVYAYRAGSWRRILDGTVEAPSGVGTSDRMLDAPGPRLISRLVDSIQVVDLAGDGAPEVAVGILTVGAGEGPLELWILSMSEDGGLRTEYFLRTTRGGEVVSEADRILVQFGVYRPQDPACCPSRIERQVIGFDEATGSIGLLKRTLQESGQP